VNIHTQTYTYTNIYIQKHIYWQPEMRTGARESIPTLSLSLSLSLTQTHTPNGRYISLVLLILDMDTLGPEMRTVVGLGFRVQVAHTLGPEMRAVRTI
jgi:hypothetical protein